MKNLHILKITAFSISVAFSCLLACSHTQDSPLVSVSGVDSLLIGKRLSPKLAAKKAAQIDTFMNYMHRSQGFNGTVLVSQYGQVIYKGAFGYGNFANHDTLTPSSSFNLASVSKQFTSVAIMQLKEKGLLNYDDPVIKYIPNFPYDGSITIRSLLTHSSGIPNYVYALDRYYNKKAPISNQLVADLFAAFRPRPNYLPNSHFNYNNSNYWQKSIQSK